MSLFSPTVRVPGGRFRPEPPVPARDVARADRRVRRAAGLLGGLAVLLVLAWWVDGGGPGGLLGGGTTAVAEAGRLCGLLAALLLLGQVLLVARIPLLERAFGQRHLIALHRGAGVASFTAMLGHVVCASWVHGFWPLTLTGPGMAAASAGTALLVLVVLSSARPVRTRLRYERWHLLHLWGYAGVFLALPHQLWAGREFTSSPLRTAFWWGLWTAAALAVVIWRIAVPVLRSRRHRITVAAVLPEGDGSVSVHMTGERLRELGASAGQFFVWRFRSGRGWPPGNPYSLSAPPTAHSLRITVKQLGDGSAAVPNLRQGTTVVIEGPYGRLTPRTRTSPRVALIGAGVGMTPLRALAEKFLDESANVVVLHRFTHEPLFAREFTTLARERNLHVVPSPGPRRRSGSWFGRDAGAHDDLAALRARIPDIAVREVYVCGPGRWTSMVRRTVLAAGVPVRRVHVENFG